MKNKEEILAYENKKRQVKKLKVWYKENLRILPKSKFVRQENANDHENTTFDVYQFDDEKFIVELKVKRNQDGLFLYYMRIYKK